MSKAKKVVNVETQADSVEVTNPAIDNELAKFTTMSAKIRYLNSQRMSRGAIAKKLNIRYQWVRNVLITEVGKPKEVIA